MPGTLGGRLSADGNAVLWHDSIDLSGDPSPRVQAMLGMAGILRAAEQLNLSRATYFRRLKAAADRVADHLAAGR